MGRGELVPKLVWRVKLVAELQPGVTTETEVARIGLGAQITAHGFGETRHGSIGLVSPPVWMTDALQGQ